MAEGQPKKFRFWLTYQSETTELKNAPDGWSKTIIEFKRSQTYMGVIRSLTLPFNFVFKGAGILRNAFYTKGVSAYVPVLIEKLKNLTYEYLTLFTGKVDFSSFEDDRAFVTASIIEDSFAANITAYDGVKYQVPLDLTTDAIQVELTPIPFQETADFIMPPTSDFRSDCFFEMNIVNNEQHSVLASVEEINFLAIANPDYPNNDHWFYACRSNCNLVVNIELNALVSSQLGSKRYQIQLVKSDGTIVNVLYDQTVGAIGSVSINQTVTVPMIVNERLFLYFKNVTDDNSNVGFRMVDATINLSYLTESPSTICSAIRVADLYDRLIQLMNGQGSGGAYVRQPTSSTLLNNLLKPLVVTCSNSIRKIVNGTQYNVGDSLLPGAKYLVINHPIVYNSITYNVNETFVAIEGIDGFTSGSGGSVILLQYQETLTLQFKDFFQSIYSVMAGNCGFGLDENDIAILEELNVFFRNISTLNLGASINALKKTPAVDQIYNSIKAGYDDQQYDTLNGFQETNSTQNYVGDLTAIQKELNLISAIRGDAFGIETLRFTPQDTSASRSDNDNFFIWLKDEPEDPVLRIYRPLRSEGWQSMTGIDSPTTFYNWKLTPKQCLYRGGPFLRSVFDSQTTIRFTNAIKNANLVVIDNDGLRVAERDDITVSSLKPAVFKPLYFDFNCKLDPDALNKLNLRYTSITFKDRGNSYSGFIMDVSTDAGQNSQRDFKLLSIPNNNFESLIH